MKILQADTFEANYGGAEANVAISASVLKLMIQHDANVASETEIEQIMKQGGTNLQR